MNYANFPNPAYILEQELLEKNLDLINYVAQEAQIEIILAFKGFAMWSAFPVFNAKGFTKATASSLFEARLCVEEMGSLAHTYSVIYTPQEIEEIAAMSSHLTFNSLIQYERFHQIASEVNTKISFGLRVNPEFSQVATALYDPCVAGSRLGILKTDLPNILPANIEGFHFHALCESKAEDLVLLLKSIEEKFASYLPQLKWINMGGGHLMTRKGYNVQLLIDTLKAFKERHPNLHIILEPGSAFAWETGCLLSRVEDIVCNAGIKTAILNISFTAHLPDCLEMPYKPAVVGAIDPDTLSILEQKKLKGFTYRLGGNSCLAGDVMGDWVFPKELGIGDLIVFKDMIHYTMVKTSMFNGVKHPAICIAKEGEAIYVKEFLYTDYKQRLS
ncbi:MAG: carboxynorspermidine decarboxylase [Bacteroidales bacterium]